ncbi:hypothetical protein UlMin_018968 [Ulmus minor]
MKEELSSLKKNGTWQLVVRPKDQKVVDSKWIYKVKEGVNKADPVRFKARLVAKGFTQREWIDYNEMFSPVIKYITIRVMLVLAAHNDWEIEQMDVKTAFLHGDLEETIYMKQPEGFEVKGRQEMVCLLKKSLYGLKHAVGSIMYTMICTRPDVAHGISLLSRFMSNPGREHWEGIKWLLRYLLSSSDVGLMFKSCKEGAILKGYVDSDFAGDKDKRRSTTSYIFTLCDYCSSSVFRHGARSLPPWCLNLDSNTIEDLLVCNSFLIIVHRSSCAELQQGRKQLSNLGKIVCFLQFFLSGILSNTWHTLFFWYLCDSW